MITVKPLSAMELRGLPLMMLATHQGASAVRHQLTRLTIEEKGAQAKPVALAYTGSMPSRQKKTVMTRCTIRDLD